MNNQSNINDSQAQEAADWLLTGRNADSSAYGCEELALIAETLQQAANDARQLKARLAPFNS